MSILDKKPELISDIIEIAQDAGKIILNIYNQTEMKLILKEDKSPLTEADIKSNAHIVKELKKITPKIPIVSEEEMHVPFETRTKWSEYWLVDPLDGIKEFIKRNGEFTVNIALIKNNKPVFGVIDIPVMRKTFWGANGFGSFEIDENKNKKKITTTKTRSKKIRILTSRSHGNKDMDFLKKISDYQLIAAGSSLKFCLIANGEADMYLRLGPTCEWDIAAGEAIVQNAGGVVSSIINKPIMYNKEDKLNPYFIAASNKEIKSIIFSALEWKN